MLGYIRTISYVYYVMRDNPLTPQNMINLDMSISDCLMNNGKSSMRLYNVMTSLYDKSTPISVLIDTYREDGIMSFASSRSMGRKTLNELNVILSDISGLPLQKLKLEGTRARVKRVTRETLEQKFQSESLKLVSLIMNGIEANQDDINQVIKSLGALNTGLKNSKK
jgi:hypothetical protein